ncbi:hypothetical protein [Bacillus sp. FJAT-26390]|uniref:hypothetical protein n=1 Tax=Bacillus sp. FJAT-26390 TaxID=1743142 RepID=UPI000807A504|nr:hypothetical protein [Bacillus sp. FJAT-26390]OBZ08038.1 hypothetical protein A7975_27310 [Bacillus sp. FJAT-26390]
MEDKLLVFNNGRGTYETGYWLNADTYPDSTYPYYVVPADSELADKVRSLYPYFTLVTADGDLIDVIARDKTQEEIDKENAPPPKTADRIRIEQLEAENADLWYDTMLKDARISEHDTDIADIWYAIMTGGASA